MESNRTCLSLAELLPNDKSGLKAVCKGELLVNKELVTVVLKTLDDGVLFSIIELKSIGRFSSEVQIIGVKKVGGIRTSSNIENFAAE
jgi:hypothetical protein